MIEAMNASRIIPIWDLCHYGYPDDLDPFSDAFVDRVAHYCRAAGMGHGRAGWLNDVMCESLAAVHRGMDLQGICLFPAVDMPDWHAGAWLHNGIAAWSRKMAT
jgi:hypothetical protein